jgi:hypothetical protein
VFHCYQGTNQPRGLSIGYLLSASAIAHTCRVLDGGDPSTIRHYGDLLSGVPAYVKVDEGARAFEAALQRK